MRIEIEIPKEFEEHFNQDKFEDSLNRLYADVHLLAGNYERELAEMLIKAFRESKPAYDIDKVVAELEERQKEYLAGFVVHDNNELYGVACGLGDAIEIVKQGGLSDDVCEWKIFDNSLTGEPQWVYETTCGKYVGEEHTSKAFVYCPYCGNKIKIIGD